MDKNTDKIDLTAGQHRMIAAIAKESGYIYKDKETAEREIARMKAQIVDNVNILDITGVAVLSVKALFIAIANQVSIEDLVDNLGTIASSRSGETSLEFSKAEEIGGVFGAIRNSIMEYAATLVCSGDLENADKSLRGHVFEKSNVSGYLQYFFPTKAMEILAWCSSKPKEEQARVIDKIHSAYAASRGIYAEVLEKADDEDGIEQMDNQMESESIIDVITAFSMLAGVLVANVNVGHIEKSAQGFMEAISLFLNLARFNDDIWEIVIGRGKRDITEAPLPDNIVDSIDKIARKLDDGDKQVK